MEGVALAFLALIVIAILAVALSRQRKRAAEMDLEDKSWLRSAPPEDEPALRTAPVRDFHVQGNQARVTFDFPLPDEDDQVLNDQVLKGNGTPFQYDSVQVLPTQSRYEIAIRPSRCL